MKRLVFILPFLLLLLATIAIGTATLVEELADTRTAQQTVYHALWFHGLWAAIVLSGGAILWLFRRALSWSAWGLHLSLMIILLGALLTSLTSQKGMLHLRIGQPADNFFTEDGHVLPLPFTAELTYFDILCYPGTEAPQDYVSKVVCRSEGQPATESRISMNHILSVNGYRLYQSSFDDDHQGSWLSVNYDPYGTPVTYTGYALLALSMLGVLFSRQAEFRKLLKHPLLKKGGFLGALLITTALNAQAEPLAVYNRRQADSLGYKQVIYNDRIMPLNTLARDFVQKLYGRSSYKNLSAEQVLLGWMTSPTDWQKIPLIQIKSAALRTQLNLTDSYCALEDLFHADGTYRLQGLWDKESTTNSPLAKAIQQVDEKVGLILMLSENTLFKPLPEDGSVVPLSEAKVRAEVLYNRMELNKLLFMANLTLGFLCFFVFLHRLLHPSRPTRLSDKPFRILLWASTAVTLAAYALRWYIAGRIPLSNGYETMQFIAVSVLLITSVLCRRLPYLLSFGFLLSGFTLLVAHLGQMNPQITPLMPVLNSPWLSSHVSLIMFSYALFAFTAINAVLALIIMSNTNSSIPSAFKDRAEVRVEQLTLISRLLLYPATFCLGTGIFLGAVWANVSWGSYWQWDAKESWALVSFLLYGFTFHRRCLGVLNSPRTFHLYMLLCFACILMTYFGVNYLLGGLHSYAGT